MPTKKLIVIKLFVSILLLITFGTSKSWCQLTAVVYSENFNSGTGGWTIGGYAPSWSHGIPTLPNILSNGSPCFVTGDAGTNSTDPFTQCVPFSGATANGNFYNCCERSFIQSPPVNCTGITSPLLSLDINLHCEQTFDGAKVQYSVNGGTTWKDVGNYSGSTFQTFPNAINCRETNWYNKSSINYLSSTSGGCSAVSFSFGGSGSGWTGGCNQSSGGGCLTPDNHGTNGWLTATHCIPEAANQQDVRIRIVFGAGSQIYSDGIGIDNVKILNVFPVTAFSYSQPPACSPTIQFTNLTDCAAGFAWDFGYSGSNNTSTVQSPSQSFPSSGNYQVTLTATDICGGVKSLSQQVNVLPASGPVIDTILTTASGICYNATDSIIISLNPPGSAPYAYAFENNGQPATGTSVANPIIISQLGAGNYSNFMIQDANGCEVAQNGNFIIPFTSDGIDVQTGSDTTIIIGNTVLLSALANMPATYSWTPSGQLSDPDSSEVLCSPLETTVYEVTATSVNGCTATDNITVNVKDNLPCDRYFIPNSFTPNGDGKNEFIRVYPDETMRIKNFSMRIFNRWGQVLFETNDPEKGWDGKNAPEGVYVLQAEFNCTGKTSSVYRGTLALIR